MPVMSQSNAENAAAANTAAAAEQVSKASTAAVEQIAGAGTANAAAMADSTNAAGVALKELSKAYQDLAARNAEKLRSSIRALAAVKNVKEFVEVEQKLIKDGVQAAVADTKNIAQLTTAVFTAAFEPVKKRIEAMQKTTH
jgi:hypothetical protein